MRSKFSLKNFLDLYSPDFVFFSEPMLFQFDILLAILITLYFPTAGKDVEFVEEIAKLDGCIDVLNQIS